jgi:uncharacterized protein
MPGKCAVSCNWGQSAIKPGIERSKMKVNRALALVLASLAGTAYAASPIDCAKAANATERTVCRTPSLLQADARMTAYFEIATQFVGMGVRGDLEDSQQAFPAVRNKCGTNKACILAAYKKQTAPLEAVIENVKTHGPF